VAHGTSWDSGCGVWQNAQTRRSSGPLDEALTCGNVSADSGSGVGSGSAGGCGAGCLGAALLRDAALRSAAVLARLAGVVLVLVLISALCQAASC
jgi:hypothetical protein